MFLAHWSRELDIHNPNSHPAYDFVHGVIAGPVTSRKIGIIRGWPLMAASSSLTPADAGVTVEVQIAAMVELDFATVVG